MRRGAVGRHHLTGAIGDLADADAPRNWQTAAHALGRAGVRRARQGRAHSRRSRRRNPGNFASLPRAAGRVKARAVLDQLARDSNDNVVEAAIDAMRTSVAHEADAFYVEALA